MAAKKWNERYDTKDYVFGTEASPFLVSCANILKPNMNALSLADGEGRNGVWLAEQGLDVLSMDFSERALEKAQELAKTKGVNLQTTQGDLLTWESQESTFDVVLALNFHFQSPVRAKIFKNCEKALKSGGFLIFEGIHKDTNNNHHDLATLYDEEIVRSLCPGLKILRMETTSVARNGDTKIKIQALMQKTI